MGCGCKKKNVVQVTPSNSVVMTESTNTNVQQINLTDQQQVEQLVKKIEDLNNTLDELG